MVIDAKDQIWLIKTMSLVEGPVRILREVWNRYIDTAHIQGGVLEQLAKAVMVVDTASGFRPLWGEVEVKWNCWQASRMVAKKNWMEGMSSHIPRPPLFSFTSRTRRGNRRA